MKLLALSLLFYCFSLSALFTGGATTPVPLAALVRAAAQGADKVIYADFETKKDNRPVSNRGGLVQLFSYQENATNPSHFKGATTGDSNAADVVRLSKDDPNKAITFDYELRMPNQTIGSRVRRLVCAKDVYRRRSSVQVSHKALWPSVEVRIQG